MHVFPWESASPVKDRLLLTIEDDSDDSDAGAGDDFSDESADDLESELDTRDDDADREGEEGNYKKRFADTKADRDRLKKRTDEQEAELESLRQENEALKSVHGQRGTKGADYGEERTKDIPDEMFLVDQLADAVNREYLALPKEKQNVRTLTLIQAKHMGKATREMVAREAARIVAERDQQAKSKTDMRTMANDALTAAGLDPKQHYSVMRGIIQDRIEADPTWFQRTPIKKQFEELASDTKKFMTANGWVPKDKVKDANHAHRREADGGIELASRRATTRQAQHDEDESDRPETMIDAMNANHRALRNRAGRSSVLARR